MARIARVPASVAPPWTTCAACWGQGRIYVRDDATRRLSPVPCYGCLGVGQTLAVPHGGEGAPAPDELRG